MEPARAAKRRMRRELGARRRALPAAQVEAAGRALALQLCASPPFAAARQLALYAALPDELPTRPLFEAALAAGRALFLPRLEGGRLVFRRASTWEELRPGAHAVPEPPAGAARAVFGAADLVLVPCVACDRWGARLGRGGGHYDAAFPPGAPAPCLVGAGHAFQIVARVPCDSRDRRMDAIVSERGFRWAERETG